MKVTPLIKTEDRLLGIEKLDWAGFAFLMMPVSVISNTVTDHSIIPFIGAFMLFIAFEIAKRKMEAKEQSLFKVLIAANRIPSNVAGVLHCKTITRTKK